MVVGYTWRKLHYWLLVSVGPVGEDVIEAMHAMAKNRNYPLFWPEPTAAKLFQYSQPIPTDWLCTREVQGQHYWSMQYCSTVMAE